MFCFGLVGLALFAWFLIGAVVRTAAAPNAIALWLHSAVVSSCVVRVFYGLDRHMLSICLIIGLLLRERYRPSSRLWQRESTPEGRTHASLNVWRRSGLLGLVGSSVAALAALASRSSSATPSAPTGPGSSSRRWASSPSRARCCASARTAASCERCRSSTRSGAQARAWRTVVIAAVPVAVLSTLVAIAMWLWRPVAPNGSCRRGKRASSRRTAVMAPFIPAGAVLAVLQIGVAHARRHRACTRSRTASPSRSRGSRRWSSRCWPSGRRSAPSPPGSAVIPLWLLVAVAAPRPSLRPRLASAPRRSRRCRRRSRRFWAFSSTRAVGGVARDRAGVVGRADRRGTRLALGGRRLRDRHAHRARRPGRRSRDAPGGEPGDLAAARARGVLRRPARCTPR